MVNLLVMNKLEKENYARLAKIGCILCRTLGYGETPAQMHHIRRFGGKRDNAPVIPLCPEHHVGNSGVHKLGRKGDFEKYWGYSEEDLLEKLNDLL